MPKVLSYEALIRGGATIENQLVVPILATDPATPPDGSVWFNSTDSVLKYSALGETVGLTEVTLDTEGVENIIASMLVAGNNIDLNLNETNGTITVDVQTLTSADITDFTAQVRAAISTSDTGTVQFTYANGVLSADVLDAPTVGGRSASYLTNVDNHVDGTTNHVFTADDDAKLSGIAAGATANATDAQLRDRGTHSGTQTASTISDFATAVAALNIDAESLNGLTAEQIQTAVTAAIVDSAPGTLDTLNEIAAALGDDANFVTTITNALNARSRNFAAPLTGGALTELVTHGLNTRDVVVQVYNNSVDYDDIEFIVRRTSVNAVTIASEGAPIPAGCRVVIHAVGT